MQRIPLATACVRVRTQSPGLERRKGTAHITTERTDTSGVAEGRKRGSQGGTEQERGPILWGPHPPFSRATILRLAGFRIILSRALTTWGKRGRAFRSFCQQSSMS